MALWCQRSRLLRMLIEDFEERGFFGAIEAQAPDAAKRCIGTATERRVCCTWGALARRAVGSPQITLSGKRRLRLRAWTEEEWTQELSMTAGLSVPQL
eukprot:Skav231721  [mRNA]  locus=scaffold2515:122264:123983:- [translate_table: standard]